MAVSVKGGRVLVRVLTCLALLLGIRFGRLMQMITFITPI